MFRKAVPLLFLFSPAISYAGLFDSTPELKCGKLSDAKSEAIPAEKRISIYKCQLEMTIARTAYLDGSELPD